MPRDYLHTSLKTSENQGFSDIFRGYKTKPVETVERNQLRNQLSDQINAESRHSKTYKMIGKHSQDKGQFSSKMSFFKSRGQTAFPDCKETRGINQLPNFPKALKKCMPVDIYKYFTGISSPVKHYNQFLINVLYSLEISENLWFTDAFRVSKKGTSTEMG